MNLKDLGVVQAVKALLSTNKLSVGEVYSYEDLRKNGGLYLSRYGYYGTYDPVTAETSPLEDSNTSFVSTTAVNILIEGIKILTAVPSVTGGGSIVYYGYGILEVNGTKVYDGRSSGGGGSPTGNAGGDLSGTYPNPTVKIASFTPNGSFSKLLVTDSPSAVASKLNAIMAGYQGININDFPNVDPTGVTDSTAGIVAAVATAGIKKVKFDGLYNITLKILMPAGQHWDCQNAGFTLNGNAATTAAIELNNNCFLDLGRNGFITRGTGVTTYSGVYGSAKYDWEVYGGLITNFGNNGIRISGSPSSPNQYKNGWINHCRIQNNPGNGILYENACEYVRTINCNINQNTGFGILNNVCGNDSIRGCYIMENTAGGVKIIGDTSVGNSDHFDLTGNTVNHNGNYNWWFQNIRYGINVTGGESIGGTLLKVENSKGVNFNGVSLGIGGVNYIDKGVYGTDVNITGGFTQGATQVACQAAIVGASNVGTVIFTNTMES